jgi:cyclopropane fatty-acyl-phospholipid synthase-like methyltransferase
MTTKRQIQDWNKAKWERKNHAMYATYGRNQWPWFNDKLDPDTAEFLVANGPKGLDVLDVGTCSGSQAIELARRGHRVVGTDISETALAQARLAAAAAEPGLAVRFMLDDIAESRLEDDQFDLVVDRGCYDSICSFNHDEYVASVRRLLKPGGAVLLKTMSSDEQRFASYDEVDGRKVQVPFHFTAVQLQTLMSPHFVIEQLRDSFYYSSQLAEPARARFAILRNGKR